MNLKREGSADSSEATVIRGLLAATHRRWLVLRNAQILEPVTEGRLDGELWIPREHIAFLQRPHE